MNLPIILDGKTVGNCWLDLHGLYWKLEAHCSLLSNRIERLYCGSRSLGVLEREGDSLCLRRQISKQSFPELPPAGGVLSLRPVKQAEPWSGPVLGEMLHGFRLGDEILFSYDEEKPCPCEPICCLFSIRDGFWRMPISVIESVNQQSGV